MRIIGGFFGRSAWGPLWEHLEKARDCLLLLEESMGYFISGNNTKLQEYARKVNRLEKEADTIKENIKQRLTRSIFSTVQRSDIIAWLREQDAIADMCDHLVQLFSLRETRLPLGLEQPLEKLVVRIIQMMDCLIEAVKLFGQMAGKEYAAGELKQLIALIEKTQKGKDEIATEHLGFLRKLFSEEKQIDPVSIFFLREAADKIVRIADRIENIGDLIRQMITG